MEEKRMAEILTDGALSLLTEEQVAAACRLNPYYASKFGGIPWDDVQPWTALFAYRIATIQNGAGLEIDGVYGPKTFYLINRAVNLELHTVDSLVIGGERVEVPFPVVDWTEPRQGGMSFYDHPSCWYPRSRDTKIDMFVLHWDASPSSQSCFQTLVNRGLSIHLMLDSDAVVYQALDLLDAAAYHASSSDVEGPENLRSVGVEICNPVHPSRNRDGKWPVAMDQPRPNGGSNFSHLDFTDAQKERVVQLCDAVCEVLSIPRTFPNGSNIISRSQAVGVVGHYHLNRTKIDPGMTLWPVLEAAGYMRVQ